MPSWMESSSAKALPEMTPAMVKRLARGIAINGSKFENIWVKRIKIDARLSFLRSPEDPFHGYYQQKLSEYRAQIQEKGAIVSDDDDDDDDVATNTTSTQVVIDEPPPGPMRDVIEWMASEVAKKGLAFERLMMNSNEHHGRYSFMGRLDPFHAFYQQKLTEYRAQNPCQDGANRAHNPCQDRADHAQNPCRRIQPDQIDDEDKNFILLPHLLEVLRPKGMNNDEFETMKLTAQFGAWYGNDFWLGFKERAGFEFTDPTHCTFPRFTRLVIEYSEVFSPPKGLKEKVSKSEAYMAAVHDEFFHLLVQWDPLQMMRWRQGGVMSMINWHASLEKDFASKHPAEELPPPPEREPETQKFDEQGLVPEDQFLAQHPGWCTIRVSLTSISSGRVIDVIEKTVQSLSELVGSFKEKITDELGIPPEHHLLFGKAGMLMENDKSLAHYNVLSGQILTLSFCRCGRERDLSKPCLCRERFIESLAELKQKIEASYYTC